ncbi:MAG: hypothetical protein JSV25_04140 [Spirochaetota bacterium]|nr:MAG: hypothetical protein JSV25_04140 [Spirochaetota bacterium]
MKWKQMLMIGIALLLICGFFVSCGHVRPRPHRFHAKHLENMATLRMDNEAKRLGLTESQMEEYEAIKERMKADFENDLEEFRKVPDHVLELLESDDPDLNEVISDLKIRMSEKPDPRMKYLDYIIEFYNILDDRQKEIFLKDLKTEIEKRHRWV